MGLLLLPLGAACFVYIAVRILLLRPRKKPLEAVLSVGGALGLMALAGYLLLMWLFMWQFQPTHGRPDSRTSKRGFEQTFGMAAPASFTKLRYWCEGGMADYMILMKFHYKNMDDVQHLIQKTRMASRPDSPGEWKGPGRWPKWWDKGENSKYEIYGGGFRYFWVDEAKQVVYYQEYTT
jgi:hypothetical protein